eukprot:1871062-Rhodomonas_salina.1
MSLYVCARTADLVCARVRADTPSPSLPPSFSPSFPLFPLPPSLPLPLPLHPSPSLHARQSAGRSSSRESRCWSTSTRPTSTRYRCAGTNGAAVLMSWYKRCSGTDELRQTVQWY